MEEKLWKNSVVTTFRWPMRLGHPSSVSVVGSFTDWEPIPMTRCGNCDDWIRSIALPPGPIQYKFLLNGSEWKTSPCEPIVSDRKGHYNNRRLVSPTITISWPTKTLGGTSVMVAGDWSSWSELLPMEYDEEKGSHQLQCCLPPGTYTIQYFIDGQWRLRPDIDAVHTTNGDFVNVLNVLAPPAFKIFYRTGWTDAALRFRRRARRNGAYSEWEYIDMHDTEGRNDVDSSSSSSSSSTWKSATILQTNPDDSIEFIPVAHHREDTCIDGVILEDRPPGGDAYICHHPGSYKLNRGSLRPFVQGNRPPIMLVSDLDGTLVGEGEFADRLTAEFGDYWENTAALVGSKLVYNTGRSIGQFQGLLQQKKGALPLPDAIITAVGTKIFLLDQEGGSRGTTSGIAWKEDEVWSRMLDENWDLESIRAAVNDSMASIPSESAHWLDDGSEHPHRLAVSVRADVANVIAENVESKARASGCKIKVVVSGEGDWRYVDFLSNGGGKLAALEYVRTLFGIDLSHCVAAGDSGNDTLMLGGKNPAVVVGNAQPALLNWVTLQPQDGRLLLADAVMAKGVLEGLARLGLY